MTEQLKEFIQQNIDLIEENKFDDLYYEAAQQNLVVGELSKVLLDAKINPVPYMNHIVPFMFSRCNFVSAYIPDNIEYIATRRCFSNCLNLEHVSLPQNLTSLGYETFYNCPQLKEIEFRGTIEKFSLINTRFGDWLEGSSVKVVNCSDGPIFISEDKE